MSIITLYIPFLGLIQLNSYDEAIRLIHVETAEHQSLIQFMSKRLQDPFLGGIVIGFLNRAKELKVRFILDEDSCLEKLPKHLQKHLLSVHYRKLSDECI